MKVYWLIGPVWGMPGHKCFFRMTMEEAQHEVDFRMKAECRFASAKKSDGSCEFSTTEDKHCPEKRGVCQKWRIEDWHVLEEEIPDKKMGWCDNDHRYVLGDEPQCSVGMVRAERGKMSGGGCRSCTSYVRPIPKVKSGEAVCLTKIGRKQFRVIFANGQKIRVGPLDYKGNECWEYRGAGYDNSKRWAKDCAKMLGAHLTYAIPNSDGGLNYVSEQEFDHIVFKESSKGNREHRIEFIEECKERSPEYAERYDAEIEEVRESPDCPYNYHCVAALTCIDTCGPDRMTCWNWKYYNSTKGQSGYCHIIEYSYRKKVWDWSIDDEDEVDVKCDINESYHVYRRWGDKDILLIAFHKNQYHIKGDKTDHSDIYLRRELNYGAMAGIWKFIDEKIRDGFDIDYLGKME